MRQALPSVALPVTMASTSRVKHRRRSSSTRLSMTKRALCSIRSRSSTLPWRLPFTMPHPDPGISKPIIHHPRSFHWSQICVRSPTAGITCGSILSRGRKITRDLLCIYSGAWGGGTRGALDISRILIFCLGRWLCCACPGICVGVGFCLLDPFVSLFICVCLAICLSAWIPATLVFPFFVCLLSFLSFLSSLRKTLSLESCY